MSCLPRPGSPGRDTASACKVTGYSFSCKAAVQAWYNGDTTGQNANYGIMLRYYDETVADYNAVYSATEVVDILQAEGKDIGYGTVIHEYHTPSGIVIISYCIDENGVYRVVHISEKDEVL